MRPSLATANLLLRLLVPGLGRRLPAPAVERREVGEADLYFRPGPAAPGVVLALGALREGRRYPLLVQVASTLAGSGYAVLVPELGRLRELVLDPSALEDLVQAVLALGRRPEARPGRVGLAGFSLGGGLALVAAADPRLRGQLAFVACLGAYFDLAGMLAAATTGRLEAPVAHAVAGSLVALLGAGERADLEAALREVPPETSPLPALASLPARARPARAAALLALLANRDPARVGELLGAVDGAAPLLDRFSPSSCFGRVEAPVWALHDAGDSYVPVAQARLLAAAAGGRPDVKVFVTRSLEHTEPRGRGPQLAVDAVRLYRFVHGPLVALDRRD